ncbi:bublin coiled-coil protein isoform X2 [Pipistrellus kuhlii]|uniref:Uncharacterized protein n=1 Tax=Pipistrellus kuhlii TaxID=59472 RepID=A0A7J7S4F5_PIPKU|nr:bublin coiled-coil protein isoform X2 [Pipistrellus kuhlii]KAF6283035.1 hypothetical protein mPipKuh1_001908 [Pipistrellus kuhlii]
MSGPNMGMPLLPSTEDEEDSFGDAEYAAINSMLDQINTCLDHLEEQNDHLHARLQELLESNRQTRLEFQQQLGEDLDDDEDDDDDEYYYDAYDAIYEDDAGA